MTVTVVLAWTTANRGQLRLWEIVASGAIAACLLWRGSQKWRQTTLAAPCYWALGSVIAVTVIETVRFSTSEATAQARYLAAIGTLAPSMALLGAKRPQNRAWQWIVLSLLLVLALPCVKVLLYGGGAPSPHLAWQWFLTVLIGAGCANHLPTRYGFNSLLLCAGQVLLLADYLPAAPASFISDRPFWGLLSIMAATILLPAAGRLRSRVRPVDRLWIDFRDAFGVVWSLRVAERFNESAIRQGWPARLGWNGLRTMKSSATDIASDDGEPGNAEAVHQALKALLLRFVTAEWIAQRRHEAG